MSSATGIGTLNLTSRPATTGTDTELRPRSDSASTSCCRKFEPAGALPQREKGRGENIGPWQPGGGVVGDPCTEISSSRRSRSIPHAAADVTLGYEGERLLAGAITGPRQQSIQRFDHHGRRRRRARQLQPDRAAAHTQSFSCTSPAATALPRPRAALKIAYTSGPGRRFRHRRQHSLAPGIGNNASSPRSTGALGSGPVAPKLSVNASLRYETSTTSPILPLHCGTRFHVHLQWQQRAAFFGPRAQAQAVRAAHGLPPDRRTARGEKAQFFSGARLTIATRPETYRVELLPDVRDRDRALAYILAATARRSCLPRQQRHIALSNRVAPMNIADRDRDKTPVGELDAGRAAVAAVRGGRRATATVRSRWERACARRTHSVDAAYTFVNGRAAGLQRGKTNATRREGPPGWCGCGARNVGDLRPGSARQASGRLNSRSSHLHQRRYGQKD